MSKTYLIDEAAEYLGVSRRSVEKLNISHFKEYRTAKDGVKRKVRVYSEDELELAKANRENAVFRPSLETTTDNPALQVATRADMQDFAKGLIGALEQKLLPAAEADKNRKQLDISSFKDKQILNFAQALAYSGLPEADLKKALDDKKIKGKKTSEKGTWKIYRPSIEEFCRNYFD